MALGLNYNPADVLFKRASSGGAPFLSPQWPLPSGPQLRGVTDTTGKSGPGPAPVGVLGAESIRATGAGPFDPAYRQNLATYAGGQYVRPGGQLAFNPTDISTLPGAPTGGGTAPPVGTPASLLQQALGGQPFTWTPPQQASQQPSQVAPGWNNPATFWLDQFLRQGRPYFGGRQGVV